MKTRHRNWPWTEPIGQMEIEENHAVLLRLIREVCGKSRGGTISVHAKSTFDQLVKEASQHFSQEEDMMRRSGYPSLDKHYFAHWLLREYIAGIEKMFAAGATVHVKLIWYLGWLLEFHGERQDQDFCDFLIPVR